jgi:hypothetical protein
MQCSTASPLRHNVTSPLRLILSEPASLSCSSKGGNSKELDPELRKRLLEQCPELAGLEDALSAMGSDAADWLIDFNKLELGYRIGSGTSSVVFR